MRRGVSGFSSLAIFAILALVAWMAFKPALPSVIQAGGTPGVPLAGFCQTDGTNDVGVAMRSPINNTLQYLPGTAFAVTGDGTVYTSGALTAGTTLAYATLNVACGKTGTIYVTSTATVNSGSKVSFDASNNAVYEVTGYPSNRLAGMWLWAINASNASSAEGTCGATSVSSIDSCRNAFSVVPTVAQGGSVDFILAVQQNATTSSFGSDEGNILSANYSSTVMGPSNIGVSSNDMVLTSVTCPASVQSVRGGNVVCWKTGPIKSGAPKFIRVSLAYPLANPGAANTVGLQFDDLAYFQDTDGKIKVGTANSAGTDQGEVANTFYAIVG